MRQPRPVHRRQRRAGLPRLQDIGSKHGGQIAGAIVGKHVDDLDAEIGAALRIRRRPGRHQQMRCFGALARDGMMMARRRDGSAAESDAERVDQIGKIERRIDFRRQDQSHAKRLGPIRRDVAG